MTEYSCVALGHQCAARSRDTKKARCHRSRVYAMPQTIDYLLDTISPHSSPLPVCLYLCLVHTDIYSLLIVYATYAHSHTGMHVATHLAWNLVLSPMSINPWKEGLGLGKTGSPVPLCVKKLFIINDVVEMTPV